VHRPRMKHLPMRPQRCRNPSSFILHQRLSIEALTIRNSRNSYRFCVCELTLTRASASAE
jgi:hypothetical protein